jgi:hypothetical protein
MYCKEDNHIFIEVNEIDSCYIDKTNFCIQITADNYFIGFRFDAKELLCCLNKNSILELKEILKNEIDNL